MGEHCREFSEIVPPPVKDPQLKFWMDDCKNMGKVTPDVFRMQHIQMTQRIPTERSANIVFDRIKEAINAYTAKSPITPEQ